MTLILIAFFAGVLTVLSPCVLPLLSVIVGGSLAGGTSYRRALTVTISLGVSVFLFTFLLKVSTAFIMVPPSFWNWLSGGILFIVGIFFLFPNLWDLIPGTARANRDSNQLMSKGFMQQSFWGDVLVGAALGPVFSTCSPTYFIVLATVLPISLALGTVDILAYILGLCLFLLIIALVGQRIIDRLNLAADSHGWFKRVIGILFLVIGILVVTNTLATIEAPLYNIFDETKIEQQILQGRSSSPVPAGIATTSASEQVATTSTTRAVDTGVKTPTKQSLATYLTLAQKALRYQRAPELVSPDGYLNTDGKPITLAQYRGKNVVLIDFWTYSCINCQRTLPYLTTWYGKYKDQGLVIIGVHTPEFAFEHVQSNVADALKRFGITYPVVLDNEYKTWTAFQNEYWPREYLIDIDGYVVHDHAGEGDYDITEKAIQDALAERAARLGTGPVTTTTTKIVPADLSGIGSPETYFGAARNQYLGNGGRSQEGKQSLTIPASVNPNTLYLGGSWDFSQEYATAGDGAEVEYQYQSKDVYLVASSDASVTVEVIQDGAPLGANAGSDVSASGIVTIGESRLYKIVANPTSGLHTLHLKIHGASGHFYTFTFG